ncbi:hypothetical protein [Ramlibacter rhizophilus]|uniref:Sporulation protein n=1 Tax=Ramlibacter rhizophilus TaxID=1781167 RepID=A0A4Z0BI24_9BURK|nr:hypothetical protein [Ramlibacter rhizophilus]TFY97917.1 hypothetical protein EZ242_15795 [Ramlibacter rhizophilus]
MLRPLVLLLILANAAWFAWAQGLLRPWGLGPVPQAEPQRLERQLRPELLRVGAAAQHLAARASDPNT